jgi:TonB-dependent receptor
MIRFLTGTSALALAAVAQPCLAAAEEAASEGEPIVVTGGRPIAESEAAALEIQKKSDSLVAVAASDSVGRLPDQNVAQAAGRLPGLAVESDQGQPRYISIRGGPKSWTTLSFDGVNVISPEGRDARFDSVPSAIASQIVVAKAVTPDMPGETVSGNVNIITRSAVDYPGFHIAAKLGAGIAEYGDRKQYEASAVVSNRFTAGDGEIGVLLSGSYFERNMITDNFENDWERVPQDQRPGFETRLWSQESENKLYRLTRKNYSGSGRIDWKPDADNTVSLRSIYTIFTDDEARDNYRFDLDDRQGDLVANTAPCAGTVNPTPTTSGYADVCIGNTTFNGTIYGIDIRQRSTLRAFRQSIFTNTIEGTHEFDGGWRFNWLGNYTRSKDDRSVVGEAAWDSPNTRTLRPTVTYDLSNPDRSSLKLFTTQQLSGPARFQAGSQVVAIDAFTKPLSSLTILDAVDTTDAYTGRLVLAKDTQLLGGDTTFKVGFQYDRRTKEADERNIVLNTAAQFAAVGIPTDFNQFSIDKPFQGEIAMDYTFRYFDIAKIRQVAKAARGAFTFTPVTANNYDVREEIYAGYAMATLRYDWGSILGGVRVERIENTGAAVGTIGGVATPVTARAQRTLAFPSLHFNYNLDDTKKLRLSFNSGAARADYDQLRPNVVVNDPNQTISGGNPAVKPERAYGVDAYFEWYLRPQGYLMIGAFYKDIRDVLFTQRRTFGSNALDSNGIDRSDYIFTGIANAGNGRLYGLEAAAQLQLEPWVGDSWLGGFGISANVTLNDSKIDKPAIGAVPKRSVRLPNTSDFIVNAGPYYEKYGISLKLQYQYRTKWIDALADDDIDGGDAYWAADDELDFSARYAVTPNFEVYFDATNLLNNPGRRFVDPAGVFNAKGFSAKSTSRYTIEWERFGRRFAGGVRVNF